MDDYLEMLREFGLTPQQMDYAMLHDKSFYDCMSEDESKSVCLHRSNVHGLGVFSRHEILKGGVVGKGFGDVGFTQIGRYINHSKCANVEMAKAECGYLFIANRNIMDDEEILADYRQIKATLNLANLKV